MRLTLRVSVFTFVALCATTALSAQTSAPKAGDKMSHEKMDMMEPASGWKELDAFHVLMAASRHPASGKNDLAPARLKAQDMAMAAKTWRASTAPKGCDSPVIKMAIEKVAAGSKEFAALVTAKSSDAVLKENLGALHKNFEVVEEGCKPMK